ncbi:hypothetical protein T440DRAFT_369496, partial [Plenodomus tracheiphilus IPT5]
SSFARDGGMAIVEIGPLRTRYHVHAALLSKHSEFFKRALNGPWKEAQNRVVKFEDVECDTFDLFIEWLYTQQLPHNRANENSIQSVNFDSAQQLSSIEASIFGDRVLAREFQKAVLWSLANYIVTDGASPNYDVIIRAFRNLPAGDPIIGLLIDAQCSNYRPALDTESNGELQLQSKLPNAFLVGVMKRYCEVLASPGKEIVMDQCDY